MVERKNERKIRKIGVLTSGGDAPGMNAAIRAVVRTAKYYDVDVVGIRKGYAGLIGGEIKEMHSRDVSNVLNLGGTILHTARCPEMMTDEGLDKAAAIYKILGLDALVVIGGDGSYRGLAELVKRGVNGVGIPATIDLDMKGTEYTIGFDTAVNTGMDALNKLRDTSNSHERCSVVEVMGRDAGYIAVWCGMCGGAEEVMFPEEKENINSDRVIQQILENRSIGKRHNLVVVAEGCLAVRRSWRRIFRRLRGFRPERPFWDICKEAAADGDRPHARIYDGLSCGEGNSGGQGKHCGCL